MLDTIDLLADTWERGVPHEAFSWLRANAPVYRHPEPDGPGFWAVTKHADIVAVSRDPATYSSELGSTFVRTQDEEVLDSLRLSILNMDPPRHERYRKLVSKGFTPRTIARLDSFIEERAKIIVDDIVDRGECEFVADVAALLPLQMICELIGIPEHDWSMMFELSNKLVGFDDPDFQTTPEVGTAAATDIFAYCDRLADDRRRAPRDDVMSALVTAEVDGEMLNDVELNLFFVTLVVAGNETTRNLISHGALALIENPQAFADLRDHPSMLPGAVEEMLRWGTSIHNFRRTATRDTQLRGQPISAGDKVVLYYLSGNRDEEVFDDPFSFDIRRDPNPHLAFGGSGVHFCLGSHLARTEIRAITEQIVTRLDALELAGPVRRMRSDFINGIKQMPVRFSRR